MQLEKKFRLKACKHFRNKMENSVLPNRMNHVTKLSILKGKLSINAPALKPYQSRHHHNTIYEILSNGSIGITSIKDLNMNNNNKYNSSIVDENAIMMHHKKMSVIAIPIVLMVFALILFCGFILYISGQRPGVVHQQIANELFQMRGFEDGGTKSSEESTTTLDIPYEVGRSSVMCAEMNVDPQEKETEAFTSNAMPFFKKDEHILSEPQLGMDFQKELKQTDNSSLLIYFYHHLRSIIDWKLNAKAILNRKSDENQIFSSMTFPSTNDTLVKGLEEIEGVGSQNLHDTEMEIAFIVKMEVTT